ncbi:MAG TPA: chloride channel protein [Candidatus Methylomirabilis sp.]|nr:chloride channel protein [Candidatus Methylomirabilis sp.]
MAFVMDLWFPEVHFVPAAFAVVGMGAVFAGTARVPLATLIMVAEMIGGYGLIVPAMLASSLSFTIQRSLAARARYPRLYQAQVAARMDSPVHYLRLVQGAFRLSEGGNLQGLRDVGLPDLSNLLRFGQSIGIHGGKGRVFAAALEAPEDPLVRRQPAEAIDSQNALVPSAVARGEEILLPGYRGTLEVGDTLILAGDDRAYLAFMQASRQRSPETRESPPEVRFEP